MMDRRTFMTWVGLSALSSSLPVAIAACKSTSAATASMKAATRPDGFTAVGSVKALNQTGFVKDKKFAAGPLLVVQDSTNKSKLIAVNSTCTHQGCAVSWKAVNKEFDCPCHGSKFNADGSVKVGPARKPLAKFSVKTEGDMILVKPL
jgi:cytochrome b6-f complex iron-sulfur subunit